VFNQMTEAMSIEEIAKTVAECYAGPSAIEYLDNPRVEQESHYYNVVHTGLVDLGLRPHHLADTLIESLFTIVERHRHRANLDAMRPAINWRQSSS
jgi:UDP-sulfoquinovose synthase